jgi:hypothetical protein
MRFWGSAAGASIAFSALVPVLFPFGAIGIPPEERDFVWLLCVFCTGVMLGLFGLSAWMGGRRGVGLRDVLEAGGATQALQRAGEAKRGYEGSYTENAAAWCVVTGALLIVIYFALFAALG